MIKVTRIDGSELIINANLIEVIEATPDTVITLVTNKKFMVKESAEEITAMAIKYFMSTGGPRLIIHNTQPHQAEDYANYVKCKSGS